MKLPPSEFVKFFPMKYGLDFLTSSALYFSSSQEFNDPFEFLPQMKNANDFRNMVCNINKEMYYINTKDKHIKERNKENSFSFSAPFLGGAAFMLTKSPLAFNPVVLSVLAVAIGIGYLYLNDDDGKQGVTICNNNERECHAGFIEKYAKDLIETKVCCLSGPNNPDGILDDIYNNKLLWAHYADKHQGIAITLERKYLQNSNVVLRQVQYKNERISLDGVSEDNIEHFLDLIMSTKSEAWSYEQEWRLIGKKIPTNFVKISPDAVKAIRIGCKVKETEVELIKLLCKEKYPKAHIFREKCDDKSFNLHFTEI